MICLNSSFCLTDIFLKVSAVVENTNVDQNCGPVSLNKSLISDPNFTATTVAQAGLNVILQTDAPQDLDLISWPPGRKLPFFGEMEGYAYSPLEGVDTYIYIIDWGINPQHTVRSQYSKSTPLHAY